MSKPSIIQTDLTNQVINIEQKDIDKVLKKIQTSEEFKIVFFGTPHFASVVLQKLIEFCTQSPDFEFSQQAAKQPLKRVLSAVVTQPDQPIGRHKTLQQSDVAQLASKNEIPVLKPEKITEEFIKTHLSFLEADLYIVVAYGKILPQSLLDLPRLGALNIHGSLLPKYRGASPIQQAILNGDQKTGITLMQMDSLMDHGKILAQTEIEISPDDTYRSLSERMAKIAGDFLLTKLSDIEQQKLNGAVQDHDKATFTKIIKKDDGYFDIDNPPPLKVLDRMIRGYFPWPTAWTRWNNKIVKLLPNPTYVIPDKDPGSIINIDSGSPAGITQNKYLIQIEGKNPVSPRDFLNGYPDFPLKDL